MIRVVIMATTTSKLSTHATVVNSRVAERVAPQASLAPAQALLARGALSERLVPPFLQSVSLSSKCALSKRPVPLFLQSVSLSLMRRRNKKRRSEKPKSASNESGRRGSNPRHSRWQRDALPLSYARSEGKV